MLSDERSVQRRQAGDGAAQGLVVKFDDASVDIVAGLHAAAG
jgi:hypothetical protein